MPLPFSLWIESSQDDRDAHIEHFNGLRFRLSTSRIATWVAYREYDSDRAVTVGSPELNPNGCATRDDVVEQEESTLLLYRCLRSAPPFEYAIARRQAHRRDLSEVECDAREERARAAGGPWNVDECCVLAEPIWQRMGRPADCRPFRPGYLWRPWQPSSRLSDDDRVYLESFFSFLFA